MKDQERIDAARSEKYATNPIPDMPIPILRTGVAGVLMGLANLVPGVSGGTMVLVVGLYNDFVTSVANVTSLHFTRRSIFFLALIAFFAVAAIGTCSGFMAYMVSNHRPFMYALFIGMTLGGVPLLWGMMKPVKPICAVGFMIGFGAMILIAKNNVEKPDHSTKSASQAVIVGGDSVDSESLAAESEDAWKLSIELTPHYGRDVFAGVLGMSAMVLPGVSGAYMLLILGRYEVILGAISQFKDGLLSGGGMEQVIAALHILIPVGIGAVVSLVALSNLLKWLLRKHEKVTLGFLLGIVCGSVIGIWPFNVESNVGQIAGGSGLAVVGFFLTWLLARLNVASVVGDTNE